MTTFKRKNMTDLMARAEGNKFTEFRSYDFQATSFMIKDKIGLGTVLTAKRRYKR